MATVTAASNPDKNDPGKPAAGTVTKTTDRTGTNDTVVVSITEDTTTSSGGKTYAQVILKINADDGARIALDPRTGGVTVTASGSGTDQYSTLTLNTADPNNWTVQVGTSGGSGYTFTKGGGGGGH